MKKLVRLIRRHHYIRLFRRLFWCYTKQGMDAASAAWNADQALQVLTTVEYAELFDDYPHPEV